MFSLFKAGAALLGKLKQPASDPEVSREEAETRIGAALQDWVIPELEKHHRLHPMDKKNLARTLLGKHGACVRILDGPGSLESRLPQVLQLALSDPDLYSSTFVWARVAKQYLSKDFRPIYPERVVEYVPLTFDWVGTQSWSNTAEEAWIRKEAVDWVFPTLAKKVPSAHQSEVEDILNRWLQDTEKTVSILSSSASREKKFLELIELGLTDGVCSSPAMITIEKFQAVLPIQLELNLCQHCGNSYPKSSMKNGSRCWDCWGG